MRICFFGHADFYGTNELRRELIYILKDLTGKGDCEFLFGGYGCFDDFAYSCVREISSPHAVRAIFVTPYITESYQKNRLNYIGYKYDGIIYPEIENVPYKFAISARNKWMAEQSDLVIGYVNHSYGGAYDALQYAARMGKRVINLGTGEI